MCERTHTGETHFAFVNNEPYTTMKGSDFHMVCSSSKTFLLSQEKRHAMIGVWDEMNTKTRQFFSPTKHSIHRFKKIAGQIKNQCRRDNQQHHLSNKVLRKLNTGHIAESALHAGKPAAGSTGVVI